jgi:PilZ domain.
MRRWRRKMSGAMCIADFRDGSGAQACRLENISNGGARVLGFVHVNAVPEFIALFVRDRQVLKRDCRVVWRGLRDVGIQFLTPPTPVKLGQVDLLIRRA